jgi:peroxiredoxin Q/BCP|tara:strand:- start:547 stop:1026 length:480 start_codon:yes stop_codon:yes gene_type:complete
MTDTIDLQVGDMAPDFTTLDSDGTSISLSDFTSKGLEVILYFYPKDSTPGCTVQACDFRDNMERLSSNDVVVLGVSKDSEKSHRNFIEKQSLNFSLLLDEDLELHHKYGVWREKSMYGKKYMGTTRSTFVIGSDRKLKLAKYNVKAKGHVDLIISELGI